MKRNKVRARAVLLGANLNLVAPAASLVAQARQAHHASIVWRESFVLAAMMILLSVILVKVDFISPSRAKEIVFLACLENFKTW